MSRFELRDRGADARRDLSELNAIVITDALLWNVDEERGQGMVCAR